MQFSNLLVVLLATAVAAKGNSTKTKAVTDKSLCNEMAKLTSEVALAANTTKLDAKAKGNSTKVAELQAKASEASVTLATMSTNTTLVSTCAIISAAQDTEDECDKMDSLMKSVALVANSTKLDAKAKGNSTKVAELQSKASIAATKLETMTTNTTLVSACSSIAASKVAAKEAKTEAKAAASSSSAVAAAASTTAASGAGVLDAKTGSILSMVALVSAGMMML